MKNIAQSYLYEGTGDPWAGHERLNGLLDASFRLELVSLPENFGVDPPTGSIKDKKVTKITKGVEWETLGQNKRLEVINNYCIALRFARIFP